MKEGMKSYQKKSKNEGGNLEVRVRTLIRIASATEKHNGNS